MITRCNHAQVTVPKGSAEMVAAANGVNIDEIEVDEANSRLVFIYNDFFGAVAEDIVQVRTDPCGDAVRQLGLRVAVSSRPLRAPCLAETGTFRWGATEQRLYAIRPG